MVNYRYSKLGAWVRLVRFGEVQYWDGSNATDPFAPIILPNAFNNNQPEITDQTFAPKIVTDVSLSYDLLPSVTLIVGANNLLDEYQDIQTHSSNQSLGRFIYSRRVEQMGYNGAYFFGRVKVNLNMRR